MIWDGKAETLLNKKRLEGLSVEVVFAVHGGSGEVADIYDGKGNVILDFNKYAGFHVFKDMRSNLAAVVSNKDCEFLE